MFEIEKMVCPTDFSEPSYLALEAAKALALPLSAEIILLHVVSPMPIVPAPSPAFGGFQIPAVLKEMEAHAKQSLEKIAREKFTEELNVRIEVIQGNPAHEIAQRAKDEGADLIVIATHGLSGWRRFIFGSVAEKVVRTAPCLVLTIPAPEEEG